MSSKKNRPKPAAKTLRDKKKAKDTRREKRKERRRIGQLSAPALPTWKRPPGPSLAEILTGPLPPFPPPGPAPDAYGLAALAMFAAAYGRRK